MSDDTVRSERPHIAFRRQALDMAATLDGSDFAGEVSAVDHNDVAGLARTIAIIAAAYDWTVADDGTLVGLVAGDQGWATTGIKIEAAGLPLNRRNPHG